MIAVDIHDLTWWYIDIHGGPAERRMGASMVSVNNALYIFGGIQSADEDTEPLSSFSIAQYDPRTGEWRWDVANEPYPAHVPNLGVCAAAVPIYKGTKILLMPGHADYGEKVNTPARVQMLIIHYLLLASECR